MALTTSKRRSGNPRIRPAASLRIASRPRIGSGYIGSYATASVAKAFAMASRSCLVIAAARFRLASSNLLIVLLPLLAREKPTPGWPDQSARAVAEAEQNATAARRPRVSAWRRSPVVFAGE